MTSIEQNPYDVILQRPASAPCDLVPIPVEDDEIARDRTTICVAEIHHENGNIEEDDDDEADDLKKYEDVHKAEEKDIRGLCLAEVDFNAEISEGDSDSSGCLKPVEDDKTTRDRTTVCVAEIHIESRSIEDHYDGTEDFTENEDVQKAEEKDIQGLFLTEVDVNVKIDEGYMYSPSCVQSVRDEGKEEEGNSQEN
jgi:hypothetical protein